MNKITNLVWIEKYRPKTFDDLILPELEKNSLINHLKNQKSIPSFIFYSSKPGTGKTSTAKVIINTLGCDSKIINSSDERGIDTIRDKISMFARSMSTDGKKRCVFLDEADGLTKQAQDSLRNLMETYSENCFFILSCNDISKIIEPLKSRCISICFETPDREEIFYKLQDICANEEIEDASAEDITKLVSKYYPDIRSMILALQNCKVNGTPIMVSFDEEFVKFLGFLQKGDVNNIYKTIYSGEFKVLDFNKWMFDYLRQNWSKYGLEKTSKLVNLLADNEKWWNQNVSVEVVFVANMLEISKILLDKV
jgi:DNA polymerase III delta prime subunit